MTKELNTLRAAFSRYRQLVMSQGQLQRQSKPDEQKRRRLGRVVSN